MAERSIVLATPVVASAMPSAASLVSPASVRQPPDAFASAGARHRTIRQIVTYVFPLWQEQDEDVHATASTVPVSSASSMAERATDHIIRFETWTGYNSTWKYFKVMSRAHPSSTHPLTLHSHTLVSRCADVGGPDRLVVRDGAGED